MHNIAVFVDGDNISWKETDNILKECRSLGRIVNAMVFGDWSMPTMQGWKDSAAQKGLLAIQCDCLKGKNSTDIKLMMEVMKMLFTNAFVEVYIIVTSDSDYRHLVTEIKMKGKLCYCIGSNNTNNSLQNICDKFIKLENIKPLGSPSTDSPKYKKMKTKVWYNYFNDIVRLSEERICVPLPKIKDEWEKKYQFDFRDWGHVNFSTFLFHYFGPKLKRCGKGNEVEITECEL